jgi:hypothetical protein
VTSAGQTTLLWFAAFGGLVAIARTRPRAPVLEAFLVAIVVSLLFNDSPNDVARLGVLSAVTLFAWSRVDVASPRRLD